MFRSGSSRYLVRESAREVTEGIRDILAEQGLTVLERPTRRGCRLRLETSPRFDGVVPPPFEIGELELRFRARGEHTEVEVRSRQRRRYWTLAVLAGLGIVSVVLDLFVSMGFATLELGRAAQHSREHHAREDPRMLEAAGSYLGRRDLGQLDAAPFRRLRS